MAPRSAKKPKHKGSNKAAKRQQQPSPTLAYPSPLEGETRAAYSALCRYLDAGPERSLRAVFPKNTNAWRWSSAYGWTERAAAWDGVQRDARRAALDARQREADLATAEADQRLRSAAAAALLGDDTLLDQPGRLPPVLVNLGRLARAPDGTAIHAAKLLVDFSGIRDLRHLALVHASRVSPDVEVPADPAVVAAVERATPEQLVSLRPAPVSVEDEYASDPDEEG